MTRFHVRFITIAALLVLTASVFAGCATGVKMDRSSLTDFSGIKTVQNSNPVAFFRVLFNVPNQKIGAHHDGLAKVPQSEHYWSVGQFFGDAQYKVVATDILKQYGYNVLGMENTLFGEDNSAKAQYQLGATIKDVKYNTYAPLAGNYSESELNVEWQLYDAYSKNTIFTYASSGYGKNKGINNACMLDAFADAFRKMLLNSEFSTILTSEKNDATAAAAQNLEKISISNPDLPPLDLPQQMEKALETVVLIKVGQSHGSGVMISPDGYVLTAEHVVHGISEVLVVFSNKTSANAKVLRTDPNQDIALLKMETEGLPYLTVSIQDTYPIGDEIFIIGNPLDEKLALTVSKGIISAVRNNPDRKVDWIQTDASINPGNSGGPMVNKQGKVIGIVSWKFTNQEGLGFAASIRAIKENLGLELMQ